MIIKEHFVSLLGPAAGRVARLARISVLLYAFALPFTHNAAIKNVALLGMLIALVMTIRERQLKLDLRSPVLASVLTVMAVTLFSSLIGVDVLDNLNAYRKHFFPLILAIPLAVVYFRSRDAWLLLLGTLAVAFGIRSGLALFEMLVSTREQGLFFKGFGIESAMYVPLLAGLALVTRGRPRVLWSAVLILAAVAVLVNGSRTALVAVALGSIVIPLVLGRWRFVLALLAVGGILGAGVLFTKPELASRYEAALQASAYAGPTGMSIRYPIWIGVWEIAKQRPLLGHGFGWKKLGSTAVSDGFLDRWKASADPYLAYTAYWFSLPTDKVNPHSLVMQLLFEVGFVGLAGYGVMLAILLWQAWALSRKLPAEWRPLAGTALGLLVGYLVINISNGLWLGSGPSIFLIALLEVCRQHEAVTT